MKTTRRNFLRYSFLTACAAALSGCGRPVEHGLLSQYQMPEYVLPGEPIYFATACGVDGVAVKTVCGRAINMEGLPGHPVCHGKIAAQTHAALQALYNPDRLLQPVQKGAQATWDSASGKLAEALKAGEGLWIVNRLQGTQGALIMAVAKATGGKIWVLDYPSNETLRGAMKALTGKAELPYYPLEEADYAVNFGSDFLVNGPLAVHYGWAYGQFRQGRESDRGVMVSVSSHMNLSCANADRWLPVRPGTEGWIAAAMGNLIGAKRSGWPGWMGSATVEKASEVTGVPAELITRLAHRLEKARKPLVLAGPCGSADAESLYAMLALNKLLTGSVPSYEPDLVVPVAGDRPDPQVIIGSREALEQLAAFKSIFVVDCNPAYLLPASLKVADTLQKASSVAFSPFENETTRLCSLTLPSSTWLEAWGDTLVELPRVGRVYNLAQPVVQPRADARSVGDALLAAARLAKLSLPAGYNQPTLQLVLKDLLGSANWDKLVIRGGAWPTAQRLERYPHAVVAPPPPREAPQAAPQGVSPWEGMAAAPVGSWPDRGGAEGKSVLVPFCTVGFGAGQFANLPWMQELPDPLASVVWSSWIEINRTVAQRLGIRRGDVVQVKMEGGPTLEGPAYPTPGIHAEAIGIPAGQGHADYGRYTAEVKGINPLAGLPGTPTSPWAPAQVTVSRTGRTQFMAAYDRRIFGLQKHTLPHE